MAEENADIRLSQKASEMAELLKNMGWFNYAQEAAIFAAAYVVKNVKDFNPEEYIPNDANGSNYSYGGLDKDGTWEKVIRILYNTETPRRCFRSLMIYGLELMGEERDRDGSIRIENYL